jgi:MFS family permease
MAGSATGEHRGTVAQESFGLAVTSTLGMAVATFLPYGLGALGPFITDDLGLSRTALGALTTVLYAVGAALSPVAGPLVDRYGGRLSLLVLFATGGASFLVAAAAPGYALMVAGAAVGGISVALCNPATNRLLALHAPPGRRGVLTGIKQSGVQVGAFLAGVALPALGEALNWRVALAVAAVPALGGVVGSLRSVPVEEPAATPIPTRATRDPLPAGVNRLAVYAGLMGLGVGATTACLPLYAVESLDMTRRVAGLTAAAVGLLGIAARIGWGRRQDRTGAPVSRSLAGLAVGSVAATALLWAASGPTALIWVGAGLFGATAVAWNALGMLAIVRDVELAQAGRASGRVLFGFYVGFVAGPVSFGWSVDVTGTYHLAWAAMTATFAAAAVLAWLWYRAEQPRLECVTGQEGTDGK